jgi:hypothetical protein
MNIESEPKLAPPGAGVPLLEKLVVRLYLLPFVCRKTPLDDMEQGFNKLTDKILNLIEPLSSEQLKTRILVPPMQGIEDSSRYWSVSMVLDHLCIVGRSISHGITQLSLKKIPEKKADIAAVKPKIGLDEQSIILDFKKFCREEYPAIKNIVQNADLNYKFSHPWFGPMNAKQWYWLMTGHHSVHLKQIKAILKSLS